VVYSKYQKISKSKAEIKKITINYCKNKKRNWFVADAECYNAHSRRYKDLFGFGDLIVIDDIELPGVLFIQITTETHAENHIADVLYDVKKRVYAKELLIKENRIWFFFFKKDKNSKWTYRIQKLTLKDF